MRTGSVARWWLLAAALVVLAVGHWLYWYGARPRVADPGRSRLAVGAPASGVALWVAYPRQNLAALADRVEDLPALLAAVARLTGLETPRLPLVEPFGVPPAHELAVAGGSAGWTASVRWYPLPAGLARLAGILAGNPWLGGGRAALGAEPVTVAWSGTVWRATAGAPEEGDLSAAGCPPAATVAVIDLGEPRPPFPAGPYCVEVGPGRLALRRHGRQPAAAVVPLDLRGGTPLVLAWAGAEEGALLFDRDSGVFPGLPAGAAWGSKERAEELVPAGEILASFGRLPERPWRGAVLAATDRAALAAAERWLAARGSALEGAELVLVADVGRAAARARDLVGAAERLLRVIDPPSARDWRDVATILSSLPRDARVEARVIGEEAVVAITTNRRR